MEGQNSARENYSSDSSASVSQTQQIHDEAKPLQDIPPLDLNNDKDFQRRVDEYNAKRAHTSKRDKAINKDMQRAAFYISLSRDINYMHYSEWEGGDKLDEDFGHEDGFYIALGYESPNYCSWLKARPFIEGYYDRFSDSIHYKGRAGNSDYNVDQKSKVTSFGVKLGGYGNFTSKGKALGYIDIGRRIWCRGEDDIIADVINYREKYYWTYFGLGVSLSYNIFSRLSLGLDTEALFTFSQSRRMRSNYPGSGLTFKLGSVYGTEIKAPVKFYLLKNLSLDLTPYFTYWHISHSDYVPYEDLYYYEPTSKTHIEGLRTGLSFYF